MKKTATILFATLFAIANLNAFAQTKQDADSIYHQSRELVNSGNVTESRPLALQAMDMYKTLYGEVGEDYINALNVYAATFAQEKKFKKAAELQQQVMDLCDALGHDHPRICLFLENMGYYCYMANDYPKATQYWERALPMTEKFSDEYGAIVQGLALMYDDLGDANNVSRMMVLIDENNKHELTLPCEEVKCMMERGEYFASTGDNAQAKEWYLKALDIAKDEEKIQVYEAFGQFLGMTMKDFSSACNYMISAANLRKEYYGENEDYFKALNTAGIYSFLGKQYQQAVDCYLPVIAFYQQNDSRTAKKNLAKCQTNLGNAYSGLKDYEKAKDCYQQAVDYYETYNKNSEEYPKTLAHLASAEKHTQDYEAAIEHYQEAMRIFEERNMMEDYSNAASSLQLCYTYAGMDVEVDLKEDAVKNQQKAKLDGIIKSEKESLQLTHDYLGELAYAGSLAVIAGCYQLEEDYGNAVSYYEQYMAVVHDALKAEFSLQSEAERMITWEKEKSRMQELKELLVTLPVENEDLLGDLSALVYDAALLSKGILLNSSIEFEKVLAEQDDDQLKAIYTQIKSNNEELEWLRVNAATDADLERILQLSQQNQTLQLQLYKGCKELADFTDYISYTWKDVQNTLNATDIAVEFLSIEISPFDKENYMVALVLTKDMPQPQALPICTLSDVKVMLKYEQLYEVDNLVWGSLSQLLEGKKRIFFSADGGFNHIAIEYFSYNGQPLSEQFEVYRLSSTKELCYHRHAVPMDNIVLFGGINYDDESTVSVTSQDDLLALRYAEQGLESLPYTQQETNEIQVILKGQGKNVVKLSGTEASQSVFLGLSDSKVNLIHVATHGTYKASDKSTDSESMQNSILAFAGANLYEETHDGIVTAADIAKMNLRQCDMVVLSACETGLGKLGDDGVFGLQRGFKNAGVHTLLMSIKSVYDDSTAEMMIHFYRHLAEGDSKREALVKAQQEIRESGYTDAKYWATFILLDAVE